MARTPGLELIRTVEHLYEDGSIGITLVSVLTFHNPEDDPVITLQKEYGQDSIFVHSPEHAAALMRAIKAAGERAGMEFPEEV